MTCMLRAGGTDFDVDEFVAHSPLVIDSLWRKNERAFPGSKTSTRVNRTSGLRVLASEADFAEFEQQVEDVVLFLTQNLEAVGKLASYLGVDGAMLDFGADIHPPGWASFTLPSDLLRLAGAAGVSICLSVYPVEEDEDEDENADENENENENANENEES